MNIHFKEHIQKENNHFNLKADSAGLKLTK